MVKKDSSLALIQEENRKLFWLRLESDLVKAVLYQDQALTLESARQYVLEFRTRVLEVFPGEDGKFDLLLLPRFDRILRERWGSGIDARIH